MHFIVPSIYDSAAWISGFLSGFCFVIVVLLLLMIRWPTEEERRVQMEELNELIEENIKRKSSGGAAVVDRKRMKDHEPGSVHEEVFGEAIDSVTTNNSGSGEEATDSAIGEGKTEEFENDGQDKINEAELLRETASASPTASVEGE